MSLASVVAALVLVAGVTIPVSNAAPEEDEMGWDCHTMGNRHC